MISKDLIDELCNDYEDSWAGDLLAEGDQFGPARIKQFLSERGRDSETEFVLFKCLCQVDMDLNWMLWSKTVDEQNSTLGAEQLWALKTKIPGLADYADAFGQKVDNSAAWKDMAQTEAGARRQWGDNVGATYYHSKLGVRIPTDPYKAQRFVEVKSSAEIAGGSVSFPLRGENVFGRQRSSDPDPLSFHEEPEGNRILICRFDNTCISRHHLTVKLLNPRFALVENHGTHLPNSSSFALQEGESVVVEFPFSVRLQSIRLLFS